MTGKEMVAPGFRRGALLLKIVTHIEAILVHQAKVDVWDGWYEIQCYREGSLIYRILTDEDGLEEYLEYYPAIQGTLDPDDLTPVSLIQELEVLPEYLELEVMGAQGGSP